MKTKRALSKVLSSQRHRGLLVLFPPDSWDHPSPTEQNLLPGQVIPEEAAGVGCPHHPSHPSLWFCNPAEGGRRGNPAWLSGISLQPRVPGLQTPNHGQSWRPNRPEEFRTSSRNREPSNPAPPLLSCSLDTFPWAPGKSWIPRPSTRKEDSKGLGGSSFCIGPKGATEQTWRSFKDIPKSKYLKC